MTIDEFKKNIAPHMKPGYAAMNDLGSWYYFNSIPEAWFDHWTCPCGYYTPLDMFDIEPVDNWQESLIEVGK